MAKCYGCGADGIFLPGQYCFTCKPSQPALAAPTLPRLHTASDERAAVLNYLSRVCLDLECELDGEDPYGELERLNGIIAHIRAGKHIK